MPCRTRSTPSGRRVSAGSSGRRPSIGRRNAVRRPGPGQGLDVLEGEGVGQSGTGPLAVLRSDARWAPQPSSRPRSWARERTYVPGRAFDLELGERRGPGRQGEPADRDLPRLDPDLPVRPGQLVEGLAVPLEGGIGGREPAGSGPRTGASPPEAASSAGRSADSGRGRPARGVVGVRRETEADGPGIGLVVAGEEREEPGGPADGDQEHPRGLGVERPAVAGLDPAEDPAEPGDDVVGRGAGRLVDDDESVQGGPSGGIRRAGLRPDRPGAGPRRSAGSPR